MIRKDKKLSMRRQCELLELNRSMIYYQPKDESDENLYVMQQLDKRHLDHPTHGVLQMQDYIFSLGYNTPHSSDHRLRLNTNLWKV